MSFANKSLLSAPLGSLSQPGKRLSGSAEISSPLSLFQTSSQHSVLSVPLSSLSGQVCPVGSQPLSDPLKTTLQNPSVLSCKPESSSLSFPTPLLSISLSTLSETPTSECDVQPANFLEDPLLSTSLSSLSCSKNLSLGQPSASSMSSLSSSSGKLSLGQPLASLSSASSLSSLLSQPVCLLKSSQTSEAFKAVSTLSRAAEMSSVEVQEEEDPNPCTSDSLCQKVHNADSVGNASDSIPKEKDYNHNHKEEKKPSATPVISSTFDSSVVQKGTRALYAIDEKPLASPIKLSVDICNTRCQKKHKDWERQPTRALDSTPPLTAKPSMFALALCYSKHVSAKIPSANRPVKQNVVNEINNLSFKNITPFNFCSPSPDDVVYEKQKRAFSGKK